MRRFLVRLSRSRFFVVSVALHLVLVLIASSVVLVRSVVRRPEVFDAEGGSLVATNPVPPPPDPAPQPLQDAVPAPNLPAAAAATPRLNPIISNSLAPASFELPSAPLAVPAAASATSFAPGAAANPAGATAAPTFKGIPANVAKQMVAFSTGTGAPTSERGSGVNKSRTFKFTAYLAKYAGGDWNSTVRVQDGKITMGSLSNILYILNKWSRDKIKAEADPVPLDLASDELFRIKPPFIFFTGHQDFKLTPKEVDNLQKYVQLGGAIWGDSSLPGRRSRFDIAFRREMKRVIPDIDKEFEPLPPTHPIFTRTYFPEICEVPPGLNFYREPVHALKTYDEIAILYTSNDYGDMWQIGINEAGEIDTRRDERDDYVALNREFYQARGTYLHNLEPKALSDSYKFGTNIILHLLTRWEDKLRNVPTGL